MSNTDLLDLSNHNDNTGYVINLLDLLIVLMINRDNRNILLSKEVKL